jgi:hypothetical protein
LVHPRIGLSFLALGGVRGGDQHGIHNHALGIVMPCWLRSVFTVS